MICTYFSAFILLVLKFSDAIKRDFDPDLFMQNMMFSHKTKTKKTEQRPSVFEANWSFSIHNPAKYKNKYGSGNAHSNVNMFDPNSFHMQGTSNLKAISYLMGNHETEAKNQDSILHKGSAMKASIRNGGSTNMVNTNAYGFSPNLLNQKLMHMSSANANDMLKDFKQVDNENSHDMLKNYILTNQFHQTIGGTKKGHNSEVKTILPQKITINNTSNADHNSQQSSVKLTENSSGVNSENKNMVKFGYNTNQLNKQMIGSVISANNMFKEHKVLNKLTGSQKPEHSSKGRNSFHFDPTDLNSKMFKSVGYNPTYVNTLTRSSARRKRSSRDFDPNAMMSKYMELRTNIDSFGSYHPNDMISTIMLMFGKNAKNGDSAKFDPNGNNMLSSTQHWGFSIYNPLHSLGQYSGNNIGRGSSGPNPNTGFNPDTLNDHLMATLSQNRGKVSTSSYQNTEFNSNNLNNKLFGGLSFNPAIVNMKTVLPIVHENIPMTVLAFRQNKTSDNGLPGLGHSQGREQKTSSAGSENGYVKNPHSHSHSNGIPHKNSGEIQNVNSQSISTINGHINANLSSKENLNVGQVNVNNGEAFLQTMKPNINFGQSILHSGHGNNMFHSNIASEKESINLGNAQATGLGSLAGSIKTNGNGYQQSMYQQGPTQGMINDTTPLNRSGGTVTQPQTQAGGLGSTPFHQNMVPSGNGLSTSLGEGKNNTQASSSGLGSTMVHHFGAGDLGSQGTAQTSPGMGNNIATQTASGNIGSKFVPQTGAGGLGYSSASQSVTGSGGPNSATQVKVGGVGANTVSQANPGGLGSISVSQTAAGSLGSSSGSGKGSLGSNSMAAVGTGSSSVSQKGNNSLGSNSVTQTSNGDLGPNIVSQSATGSLGSNVFTQTNSGGMGAYIISQTAAGGLGSSIVSQSGSGSLGSNSVTQTHNGGLGSNTISQTATGKLGLNTVTQTGTGELRSNKVSQILDGGVGTSKVVQSDGETLEPKERFPNFL